MLGTIEQRKLEAAAADDAFLAHLERVIRRLEEHTTGPGTWFEKTHDGSKVAPLIAYFSAEFGLTECLSIFAGGLGILSGDSCATRGRTISALGACRCLLKERSTDEKKPYRV